MFTIRTVGDKILTQKAKRVAHIDDTIRNLCASMVETMVANEGIGLAANQVGILKRIITIIDGENVKVMINPELLNCSDMKVIMDEGCLSIPGTYLKIARPETIRVKYRDLGGKPHAELYHGLTARVIMHEIEHLDGVLMVEHINNLA